MSSWELLNDAEENELHKSRLLNIEEKPLKRITKRLAAISTIIATKAAQQPTPPPDAGTADANAASASTDPGALYRERALLREDLALDFAAFDSSIARLQFLLDANERERARYAADQQRILDECQAVRDNNAALRARLDGITLLDLDGILRCEHEALEEHLGRVGFGGALLGEEILEDNGRLAALLVVVLGVGAEEVAKNVYGMLGAERHRPAVLRVDDGGDRVIESGYRVTLNLAGLAIIITHLEAHVVVIGSDLEYRAVIGHDARSVEASIANSKVVVLADFQARRLGCSVVIVALHISNPAVAFPLELWRASRSERQQAPQFRSPGRTTTVEQDVGDESTALLHVNQSQNERIPWQEGLRLQDIIAIRLLFLNGIAGQHGLVRLILFFGWLVEVHVLPLRNFLVQSRSYVLVNVGEGRLRDARTVDVRLSQRSGKLGVIDVVEVEVGIIHAHGNVTVIVGNTWLSITEVEGQGLLAARSLNTSSSAGRASGASRPISMVFSILLDHVAIAHDQVDVHWRGVLEELAVVEILLQVDVAVAGASFAAHGLRDDIVAELREKPGGVRCRRQLEVVVRRDFIGKHQRFAVGDVQGALWNVVVVTGAECLRELVNVTRPKRDYDHIPF
ncbi:hypothetical protein BN1708_007626 [Verticillium longisporum]|uniref:Uncharacterized protein n=1 Tax=Verticillium longisporum TaxID=100787 RepID=A0A0G4MUN3_VERLO|nr:hypothetical protein BN1708_007626 [Verticillium longisporum]